MADIGQDLLNVPMGDMIRQMALAIADAQFQLDTASIRVAEVMSGRRVIRKADGAPDLNADGTVKTEPTTAIFGRDADGKPQELSLLELGFSPTFYQFVDTLIEVKIAIKFTREETQGTRAGAYNYAGSYGYPGYSGYAAQATSVDASYASKYNYNAEGASLLRTKLVPVPPPSILDERIRKLLDLNRPTTPNT